MLISYGCCEITCVVCVPQAVSGDKYLECSGGSLTLQAEEKWRAINVK